jgi:hypothetical protein
MPAFNLLAQAISDLVRYPSAATILTNKRKRRLYNPGTIRRRRFRVFGIHNSGGEKEQ